MNILSLDIDYISDIYAQEILHPGIPEAPEKDYWNLVRDLSSRISEEVIIENRSNVRYLFKLFLSSITTNSKVVFGIHHDSILSYIPKDTKSINLLNVDHHHDLGYNELQEVQASSYQVCTESNWVAILADKLDTYTWVRNKGSESRFNEENFPYKFKFEQVVNTEALDTSNVSWDLIYVCLSPNYLYDKHWVYFYLLLDIYETLSGHNVVVDKSRYNTKF